MAGRIINTSTGPVSLGGAVEFEAEMLHTLPAISYSKTGVILANERKVINVKDTEGNVVAFTCSVYFSRPPLDDDEAEEVAKVKDERDSKAKEKADAVQSERERAIKAAGELAAKATNDALRGVIQDAQQQNALMRNMFHTGETQGRDTTADILRRNGGR